MTNIERIRFLIGDTGINGQQNVTATQTTMTVSLDHKNVSSLKVYVLGQEVEFTLTDQTLIIGNLTLDQIINVVYTYHTFTDEELTEILANNNGKIYKAAVEAITYIMADSARMFDYKSGQSEMKMSKVFDQLKDLKDELTTKAKEEDPTSDGAGAALIIGRCV